MHAQKGCVMILTVDFTYRERQAKGQETHILKCIQTPVRQFCEADRGWPLWKEDRLRHLLHGLLQRRVSKLLTPLVYNVGYQIFILFSPLRLLHNYNGAVYAACLIIMKITMMMMIILLMVTIKTTMMVVITMMVMPSKCFESRGFKWRLSSEKW